MMDTATYSHHIRGNAHELYIAGIQRDRGTHCHGAVYPLRVDQAALGHLWIEWLPLGHVKGVWVERGVHLDSLANLAMYDYSLPAQLSLVWEGQPVLKAPVRERHDNFYIPARIVVFLSDKAGYLIGVESHKEADWTRHGDDFNDAMRSATELLAAGISNHLLPGFALSAESIPYQQLGIEQKLLATNSSQAIGFHGTSRLRVQGYVRARDVSFITNDNLIVSDVIGQWLQDGPLPTYAHAIAGQIVDGDDGKV
jgi:hypothetical protein